MRFSFCVRECDGVVDAEDVDACADSHLNTCKARGGPTAPRRNVARARPSFCRTACVACSCRSFAGTFMHWPWWARRRGRARGPAFLILPAHDVFERSN